jgi:toxin ParE1/3/4
MIRLRLTREARNDLRDIRLYSIRDFGRDVANAFLRRLAKTVRQLQEQPRLSEPAIDISANARIFRHRTHRIVNRLTDHEVTITMVVHQARDLAVLMERLRLQ